MPDLSYSDIVFKPLDAFDDVSSFHSTEQELDDFLFEDALNNQTNRLSATFLACWDDELVGYFTLINDSIVAEDGFFQITPENNPVFVGRSGFRLC
jgi:hypothetical protein